eukprot:TRINITY_DN3139_c0_g1_i5.p1 TRINITY_DN3139_c0_g1~~TRINITY_DN3139_c0_g1_i5.p1  ORF type:complete len:278 (-),score=17.48 TRINITY_DN3139_c0_g1_i5:455-1288(-)
MCIRDRYMGTSKVVNFNYLPEFYKYLAADLADIDPSFLKIQSVVDFKRTIANLRRDHQSSLSHSYASSQSPATHLTQSVNPGLLLQSHNNPNNNNNYNHLTQSVNPTSVIQNFAPHVTQSIDANQLKIFRSQVTTINQDLHDRRDAPGAPGRIVTISQPVTNYSSNSTPAQTPAHGSSSGHNHLMNNHHPHTSSHGQIPLHHSQAHSQPHSQFAEMKRASTNNSPAKVRGMSGQNLIARNMVSETYSPRLNTTPSDSKENDVKPFEKVIKYMRPWPS